MSWKRGELWFDPDVLWVGEAARVPALAGFAPAPVPAFASPPGLAASRLRRATWKQRRHARRARATALALSPAVMFALTALRSGSVNGPGILAEDPPSLTFRVEERPSAQAPGYLRRERVEPSVIPSRVHGTAALAGATPRIDWHHARSVGVPYGGSLVDGTQLPVEGPNWVTWNPVTDSVPNAPRRLYGNQRTIRAVVAVIDAYSAANPDAPRVVIGDISREGGGPMTDEHVSHQNGLDVDLYYPRLDGRLRAPDATDQIDRRLAQDLLDRFVAAGAQMVFVGYSTGLEGPAGVGIPSASHENHMHVRSPPPGG